MTPCHQHLMTSMVLQMRNSHMTGSLSCNFGSTASRPNRIIARPPTYRLHEPSESVFHYSLDMFTNNKKRNRSITSRTLQKCWIGHFNPLTPTVAIWVQLIKHLVPERIKPSFVIYWHPGTLTLSPECQCAWVSKITNDVLTRSGRGCFISCTHMATVGVKGLIDDNVYLFRCH